MAGSAPDCVPRFLFLFLTMNCCYQSNILYIVINKKWCSNSIPNFLKTSSFKFMTLFLKNRHLLQFSCYSMSSKIGNTSKDQFIIMFNKDIRHVIKSYKTQQKHGESRWLVSISISKYNTTTLQIHYNSLIYKGKSDKTTSNYKLLIFLNIRLQLHFEQGISPYTFWHFKLNKRACSSIAI